MPLSTRVLLVDDDASQRAVLGRYLSQLPDVRADIVPSATDALRLLRARTASREPYHLLVTDHEMEPMMGLELLARTCTESPGTMRVMMSGNPDVEDRLLVHRLTHAFLPKPVSRARLGLIVALARED